MPALVAALMSVNFLPAVTFVGLPLAATAWTLRAEMHMAAVVKVEVCGEWSVWKSSAHAPRTLNALFTKRWRLKSTRQMPTRGAKANPTVRVTWSILGAPAAGAANKSDRWDG